ncbi:MAG TPA: CotH kinase family protein, partial [Kofleriaceae bacterium]|nr:CotH kinase family protein [Kofleriaceae bacterium]
YTVAVCAGAGAGGDASLTVDGVPGELTVAWPVPWPESLGAACDAGAIGAAPQVVPEVFEILFTDDERAVYADRVASLSKEEFSFSLRLAADQEPIAASAHLHGKGTLGCDRKSYTVTLDGPGRHLFADDYADEVFLIAMCADDRYLQLYTSYQLLAAEGLFPLSYRYVELVLDGEQRGVYLLVEKSDDALVRDNSRVSAVLRRRDDAPGDHMEVEKSRGDAEAASGAWATFEQSLTAYAGEDLLAAAEERIDLERYLVWIALMTALENGDYVDEVLLTATDARSAAGDVPEYWTFTAWDNDDLFSACHHGGKWAMVDPNELLYCVEADIDRILFADPVVYARYADVMSALLDRLTPDRMQQALDATGAALLPYFERPEICAAMTELLSSNPAASDPSEAQRDIREHLDLLRDDYQRRRAFLRNRLADLPAAASSLQPSPRRNWPDLWSVPSRSRR